MAISGENVWERCSHEGAFGQGLRDIIGIRYDECAPLKEYIEKMVWCSPAIQCNRGEKDGGDRGKHNDHGKNRIHLRGDGAKWLWCQFILVSLGRMQVARYTESCGV